MDRFTPSVEHVLRLSNQIAHSFNSSHRSSGHALLSILRTECLANSVLAETGVEYSTMRKVCESFQVCEPEIVTTSVLLYTCRLDAALRRSEDIARAAGMKQVTTIHLLLALLGDSQAVAVQVLTALRIEIESILKAAKALAQKSEN